MTAGFLTRDAAALLDAEPCLAAAARLLGDDGLPVALRDGFREQLTSLSAVYALAGRAEG